ncbi:MAG: hypothetical protein ACI9SE_004613 [Neolewinella sp.]|jgi:hypothetical protein|tara:strand:- start:200 stop:328 length:129 start_codon:yes stop_codon:yes gene_type:complete
MEREHLDVAFVDWGIDLANAQPSELLLQVSTIGGVVGALLFG